MWQSLHILVDLDGVINHSSCTIAYALTIWNIRKLWTVRFNSMLFSIGWGEYNKIVVGLMVDFKINLRIAVKSWGSCIFWPGTVPKCLRVLLLVDCGYSTFNSLKCIAYLDNAPYVPSDQLHSLTLPVVSLFVQCNCYACRGVSNPCGCSYGSIELDRPEANTTTCTAPGMDKA